MQQGPSPVLSSSPGSPHTTPATDALTTARARNSYLRHRHSTLIRERNLLLSQLKWTPSVVSVSGAPDSPHTGGPPPAVAAAAVAATVPPQRESFHIRESKMTFGQRSVYCSDIETMKSLFRRYVAVTTDSGDTNDVVVTTAGDDERLFMSVSDIPNLIRDLGEDIEKTPHLQLGIQMLQKSLQSSGSTRRTGTGTGTGTSGISFDQFLTFWLDLMKGKKTGTETGSSGSHFSVLGRRKRQRIAGFDVTKIRVREEGIRGTRAFRMRYFVFEKESHRERLISVWHDIPLFWEPKKKKSAGANKTEEQEQDKRKDRPSSTPPPPNISVRGRLVHFVCEVPKWTRRKFLIDSRTVGNPVRQDVKFGRLREYRHGDMMFNYGCLPQTWVDPEYVWRETGRGGDADPVDFVEIGTRQMALGEVKVVKVLGCLCFVDLGKTEWKIIGIRIDDPLARQMDDFEDVRRVVPGAIDHLKEYFRIYKVCTGNKPNVLALGERCQDADYAMRVVAETHRMWRELNQRTDSIPIPPNRKDTDGRPRTSVTDSPEEEEGEDRDLSVVRVVFPRQLYIAPNSSLTRDVVLRHRIVTVFSIALDEESLRNSSTRVSVANTTLYGAVLSKEDPISSIRDMMLRFCPFLLSRSPLMVACPDGSTHSIPFVLALVMFRTGWAVERCFAKIVERIPVATVQPEMMPCLKTIEQMLREARRPAAADQVRNRVRGVEVTEEEEEEGEDAEEGDDEEEEEEEDLDLIDSDDSVYQRAKASLLKRRTRSVQVDLGFRDDGSNRSDMGWVLAAVLGILFVALAFLK